MQSPARLFTLLAWQLSWLQRFGGKVWPPHRAGLFMLSSPALLLRCSAGHGLGEGRGEWLLSRQPELSTIYALLSLALPLSVPQSFLCAFFIAGRTRSLLSLCRIAVRRILGKSRLDLIHVLPIPDPIKQFLLHEHS